MKITKDKTVISVYLDDDSGLAGFEQNLFLISDLHYDSVYCDRSLLKRDFDKAKNTGAFIMIAGDFFDAMQGRKDKRGNLDELRTEYKTENYFNALVDDAYEFLKPYQESIVVFGYGNHETSVSHHNQIDLISMLVGALNNGREYKIQTGGYGGWVRFMFKRGKSSIGSVNYRYHHGKGASAFVTDGIMDDKRAGVFIPDADIIHFGHNHKEYVHTVAREKLNGKGIVEHDKQLYVRTPGYKNSYIMDREGLSWDYAVGGSPTPLGGVTVTIGIKNNRPKVLGYTKTF
jgi:UDP-2,3-diacylglucosamine pyrophosphatase LpxH